MSQSPECPPAPKLNSPSQSSVANAPPTPAARFPLQAASAQPPPARASGPHSATLAPTRVVSDSASPSNSSTNQANADAKSSRTSSSADWSDLPESLHSSSETVAPLKRGGEFFCCNDERWHAIPANGRISILTVRETQTYWDETVVYDITYTLCDACYRAIADSYFRDHTAAKRLVEKFARAVRKLHHTDDEPRYTWHAEPYATPPVNDTTPWCGESQR